MKKKHILIAALMGFAFSSCSDFLDRKPLTEPSSDNYLSSYAQIQSYINGLYIQIPALTQYGMGTRSEEKNSDNILAQEYDKRLNGEYTAYSGSEDWQKGYENLRGVNYFISNYAMPSNAETEVVLSLKGEAYFLRAYWHYYLLTRFGDIPVMDAFWDDKATVAGLQIPATDRADVARFILEDIDTAKGLLQSRSANSGLRISKEAALIFGMRVALYEGSWEKYHAGTEFAASEGNPTEFFQKAMNLGDELFALGTLSLNTKDNDAEYKNPGDAFAHLFNKVDLSGTSEAVFWKKYSLSDGVFHNLLANLGSGVVETGGPAGLSQALVDNYLKQDGHFIDPTDATFKDFNQTFENRDYRLLETVMHSDCKFKSTSQGSKPMLVKSLAGLQDADAKKVNPPYLNGDLTQQNLTGYHTRLGIDTTFVSGNSETGYVLIRYAEALLSYAEAAEELGKCDDAVLEKTLKPLRERAGVTYIAPSTLGIDPNFPNFGYSLTANMQEIRRERRSELALQGFRLDDLMRWRAHSLFRGQRGKGAYLGADGVLYSSYGADAQTALDKKPKTVDGWLDPLQTYLPNGYQFNPERDYLLPIPPDELQLNKQLVQNPGKWQ